MNMLPRQTCSGVLVFSFPMLLTRFGISIVRVTFFLKVACQSFLHVANMVGSYRFCKYAKASNMASM